MAGVPRARPSRDLAAVERRWLDWHGAHARFGASVNDNIAQKQQQRQQSESESGIAELSMEAAVSAGAGSGAAVVTAAASGVTVVIVARDATGAALRMTLLSALRMSPPPALVVVAPTISSSSSTEMPATLAALLTPAEIHRVQWHPMPGASLAAARNAAAVAAASAAAAAGPLLIADAGTFLVGTSILLLATS